MLNFSTDVQELISAQETVKRTKSFMDYTSKKKLFDAGVLNEQQKTYIQKLKGTFNFALHTGNRYLVVTLYNSKDKKYRFLVVDLETFQCAEADSIKNAKKEVMEIIANATPEVAAEEEDEIVVKEIEESSKKNKK